MPPTVLYLVRHGSVVDAERRRFIGRLDIPLSPLGEAQVSSLAARLAAGRLEAVSASELCRALRSAVILAAPHRLTPRLIPALREMAMGRWEGLTADEIAACDPETFSEWMVRIGEVPFPEGESVRDLDARVWPAVEKILAEHGGGHVALVAHGGTNRVVLCRALGLPLERVLSLGQDYAALSILELSGDRWTLRLLNHTEG
jgi:broad specificity phosphatase PhoE